MSERVLASEELPAAPALPSGEAGAARVSVLLPVYNGGKALDTALLSLCAQTLSDWDCVAVDDGSTDGTWQSLLAWAERDQRIRPCRQPHGGIVSALATALQAVSPAVPYLARLDADDECRPERLARQLAFLDAHPELDLVSCGVRFGGDPALAGGFAYHVAWLNSLLSPRDIALARFRESPLAHPSVLFRRVLAQRYGWYASGPFPEDYELWLRWLDAGVRMAKLPEELLIWNDPPGRLTRNDARYSEEAFARVRAFYLARHLARHLAQHVAKDLAKHVRKDSGLGQDKARPEVWVWGAGRVSRRRAMPLLEHGVVIRAWVDIDAKKIGNRVAGLPVVGPDALPPPGQGFILVFLSARGAAEEAASWLTAHGYAQGEAFLLCS